MNYSQSILYQRARNNYSKEKYSLCQDESPFRRLYTVQTFQSSTQDVHVDQSEHNVQIHGQYNKHLDLKSQQFDLIVQQLLSLTPVEQQIFNYLIALDNQHDEIKLSIRTLSENNGTRCTQRTVCRALKKLTQLHFIFKYQKEWDSNRYYVAEEFHDPELRFILSEFLTAFRQVRRVEESDSVGICHSYIKEDIYIRASTIQDLSSMQWRGMSFAQKQFFGTKSAWQHETASIKLASYHGSPVMLLQKKEPVTKCHGLKVTQKNKVGGKITTKGEVMIPQYIKNIRVVALSHEEMLELSVYSEVIIQHACKRLLATPKVTNKVAFFKAVCSKEHELRQQKASSFSLKKQQAELPSVEEIALRNKEKVRQTDAIYEQSIKQREVARKSWAMTLDEAAQKKQEALSHVKDPGLRMFLATLYDKAYSQASSNTQSEMFSSAESDNPFLGI